MKTQTLLRLIPLVVFLQVFIAGCVGAPVDGHRLVYMHGEVSNDISESAEGQIAIGFCYEDDLTTVDIDSNGKFERLTDFMHGGIMVLIPPLGQFPRNIPLPPRICVSFPEKPGEYYEIEAERDDVSWKILRQDDGEPLERNTIIPTLVEAELKEFRGDWILRLRFTNLN